MRHHARFASLALALLVLLAGCTSGPRLGETAVQAKALATVDRAPGGSLPPAGTASTAVLPSSTALASPLPAGALPAATAAPSTTNAPAATSGPTPAPRPTETHAPASTNTPAPTATPTAAPLAAAIQTAVAEYAASGIRPSGTPTRTYSTAPSPLQIDVMRQGSYPGSEITIEQTLAPGANYARYIVSYRSEGLRIYALMTVPDGTGPNGPKPATGWPVVIFNHGYIPPAQYRTTERYVAYVDMIARAGYIVFKSDYRGHGSSEGSSTGGGYGSPGYTVDVLNAVASMKAYKDADPNRIGMWGHSMGGYITLRAMVISKDIKAGVIWGGVVAPYPIMMSRWTRLPGAEPLPPASARRWRQDLINQYGMPEQNPAFWASISANTYVNEVSGPIQLHHSTTDEEVPLLFGQTLYNELQAAGQASEMYTYAGDNHNINANFNVAMARSIAWFDKYVKGK